jgi:hypothetical protein
MGSNGAMRSQRTPISKRGLSDWREQVGCGPRARSLRSLRRAAASSTMLPVPAQLRSECHQKAKERRREWVQRQRAASIAASDLEVRARQRELLRDGRCARRAS